MARARHGAAVAALLLAGAGCSLVRAPSPPPVRGGVQVGVASWYGPGFHGRRTANGEVFDQNELTAAHPSLPHGTRVMVTNLDNGRAVEVRINDRGPFVDGRVIDLSYAAARAVHMVGPGTARVRLDVLDDVAPPPEAPRSPIRRVSAPAPRPALAPPPTRDLPDASFTVEVATMSDAERADHLRRRLARRFPDAFVAPLASGTARYYRVRLGPYPLRAVALARAELVSRMGYSAIIVEETP
jgi:rare lipoprotein A